MCMRVCACVLVPPGQRCSIISAQKASCSTAQAELQRGAYMWKKGGRRGERTSDAVPCRAIVIVRSSRFNGRHVGILVADWVICMRPVIFFRA